MAAVLLKVNFSWQHGYIKQPVTSEACVWKQPRKQSLTVTPQLVNDMNIVKPKIAQTGTILILAALHASEAAKINFCTRN